MPDEMICYDPKIMLDAISSPFKIVEHLKFASNINKPTECSSKS